MTKPNSLQRALLIAKILVGLEYVIVFSEGIIWPIVHFANSRIDFTSKIWLIASHLGTAAAIALLFIGMRFALKRVSNREAVELWSLIALGAAPISGLAYLMLASSQPQLGSVFEVMLGIIGFVSPFVLLSCWVKYHYREDEF